MRKIVVVFCLAVLAATAAYSQPSDVDTIEAIEKTGRDLGKAIGTRDTEAIKALTTPDHVAITPYYGVPLSLAEQIASLGDLDFKETNVSESTVTLLGPDVALRTSIFTLKGSYRGKPLPEKVFATEVMVKRDGKWLERLFQATALTQ